MVAREGRGAGLIRLATAADAAAIRDIYAPYVTDACTSFEYEVPTVDVMLGRIVGVNRKHAWLVAEQDGRIIGYAYGAPHRARTAYQWSVEVSVYLDRSAQRKGIGRALYEALFERLRAQGYYNAYAGIALPNEASVRLHEAMGFQSIGVFRAVGYKFGRWHDVGWWQMELRPQRVDPAPPGPPLP